MRLGMVLKRGALALLGLLALAGCTRDQKRALGDWLFLDRSPITFEVDAVRPIYDCKDVPDPRYPCHGVGPEGFWRDLVVKPFANKHFIDTYSDIAKAGSRTHFTWFSMQGGCGLGSRSYMRVIKPGEATLPYRIELADRSVFRHSGKWRNPIKKRNATVPLGDCDTGIDIIAGQPFRMEMTLWAPGRPLGGALSERERAKKAANRLSQLNADLTIPVIPSATNKFKTGCRKEKHNDLEWTVCRTAFTYGHIRMKESDPIRREERQLEVWATRLGKPGFILQIDATYAEPLFRYPQWYAERQANIVDVVKTITLEPLTYPPVIEPSEGERKIRKLLDAKKGERINDMPISVLAEKNSYSDPVKELAQRTAHLLTPPPPPPLLSREMMMRLPLK